jgi:hypothetical protein
MLSFVLVSLVEGSLLVCTCLVSGCHKLWTLARFLDGEDDTTPDFRGFSVSHEKNCELWIKNASTYKFYYLFCLY